MLTQKQAQPAGGKTPEIKQSDCVLCANSVQCECFSKSASGKNVICLMVLSQQEADSLFLQQVMVIVRPHL